eukprot:2256966-Amphidinium_carterae.1
MLAARQPTDEHWLIHQIQQAATVEEAYEAWTREAVAELGGDHHHAQQRIKPARVCPVPVPEAP